MTDDGEASRIEDAKALRARMRADLVTAMKSRDKDAIAALRTAIAAIDNAEAVETSDSVTGLSSEHVAGAQVGVGSTEAERRVLTLDDVRALIQAQADEYLTEAARYDHHDQVDAATRLRHQAGVLLRYLAQ